MRKLVLATLAAAGLAAGITGASGQELTQDDQQSAVEFALNNTWFVLYHELGHMLVDQLGLPVLGREEDAVDNVATYSLLTMQTDAADQALSDATYGWVLADQQVEEFDNSDFYDEHSLDLQRAYAITCLMVGNDPDRFAEAADYMEMDPDRQESCASDYAQVEGSIVSLLTPFEGKGKPIKVVYDKADPDFSWAEEALKASTILETTAKAIDSQFALPREITIRATQCGEPNAFYDPESEQVSVCYELLDDYLNMIVADMQAGDG